MGLKLRCLPLAFLLIHLGACNEAIAWAHNRVVCEAALKDCPNPDWRRWLSSELAVSPNAPWAEWEAAANVAISGSGSGSGYGSGDGYGYGSGDGSGSGSGADLAGAA